MGAHGRAWVAWGRACWVVGLQQDLLQQTMAFYVPRDTMSMPAWRLASGMLVGRCPAEGVRTVHEPCVIHCAPLPGACREVGPLLWLLGARAACGEEARPP